MSYDAMCDLQTTYVVKIPLIADDDTPNSIMCVTEPVLTLACDLLSARPSSIFDFYDSIPLDPASNETNKNYNLIIVSLETCYLFNCFNCDLGLFSLSQSLCLDTRRRRGSVFSGELWRVKCLTPQVCLGLFVVYARVYTQMLYL